MITGMKSNEPRISRKTTKEYWLVMDDGNPVGVCTERDADACLDAYALKKGATRSVGNWRVYFYGDSSGVHCITLRKVPRMKIVR